MNFYIYLDNADFVNNWTNGGELPIKEVVYYLSDERKAEKTIDEGRLIEYDKGKSYDEINKELGEFIRIGDKNDLKNVEGDYIIKDNIHITDGKIKQFPSFEKRDINGIVLCLSNKKCKKIAEQFGRKYCVEITHLHILKQSFDEQLGKVSISDKCKYTSCERRNHFLKSKKDKWQHEYRIIWEDEKETSVIIPKGVAKEVKLY